MLVPVPARMIFKKNANSSIILFIQIEREFFSIFLVACIMEERRETLVNSSVFDSSCGRTIISWKVYCIEDEKLTLQGLYDVHACN